MHDVHVQQYAHYENAFYHTMVWNNMETTSIVSQLRIKKQNQRSKMVTYQVRIIYSYREVVEVRPEGERRHEKYTHTAVVRT